MEELSRRKQKRHPHNLRMLNFKPTTQSSVFTRPQPTGSRNEPRPPSRQASERTPTTSADGQRNEPQPPSRRAAGRLNCAQPRTPEAVTRSSSPWSDSLNHGSPTRARRGIVSSGEPSSRVTPILVHGKIYTRYRKLQAWQPLRERGTTLNNRLHNSRKSLHLREFIQSGGRYSPRSPPSRR